MIIETTPSQNTSATNSLKLSLVLGFSLMVISGCNAPGSNLAMNSNNPFNLPNIANNNPGAENNRPDPGNSGSTDHPNSPNQPPTSNLGEGCHSSDLNQICLGIKYVTYKNTAGTVTATETEALENLRAINQVWAQCRIQFQIDHYLAVNPADFHLAYATANLADLDDIRNSFEANDTLLIVTTGTWNRGGSLGNTGANAWTNMPGGGPYGVVLEQPVATYGNIIAHEIGHYLNLPHTNDTSALMNPIIYGYSTSIYTSQCSTARTSAQNDWPLMMR